MLISFDKGLHEVRLGRVEQVNERVRLFRLDLVAGPIKASQANSCRFFIMSFFNSQRRIQML